MGESVPFSADSGSPVSAIRTYDIFNKNGWVRSLYFLAAWFLVGAGSVYLVAGIGTGHLWRHLVPCGGELTPGLLWRDVMNHLHRRIRAATGGPQYGLLQKCAYCTVIFIALPLEVLTGLTMSPAITAAYPFLLGVFGGLLLSACSKKLPPTYGNILRMGDVLTYSAHRTLLPGQSLDHRSLNN